MVLLLMLLSLHPLSAMPPGDVGRPADPAETAQILQDMAAVFALPPPTSAVLQQAVPLRLWSTHYVLHPGVEVAAGQGTPLLDMQNQPFPPGDPIHLTARDWCFAALEGSATILRLDGSRLTINYAGTGALAVDCGPPLGNARWRGQGTVRFAEAAGPYGDGVAGLALVPFRSVATDPTVIPTGSLLFVPDAVGVPFTFEGESFVHDGYFFAADVGGAIRGSHIDTFTGAEGSPFPHVGDRPQATFDGYVLAGPGAVVVTALSALHQP